MHEDSSLSKVPQFVITLPMQNPLQAQTDSAASSLLRKAYSPIRAYPVPYCAPVRSQKRKRKMRTMTKEGCVVLCAFAFLSCVENRIFFSPPKSRRSYAPLTGGHEFSKSVIGIFVYCLLNTVRSTYNPEEQTEKVVQVSPMLVVISNRWSCHA